MISPRCATPAAQRSNAPPRKHISSAKCRRRIHIVGRVIVQYPCRKGRPFVVAAYQNVVTTRSSLVAPRAASSDVPHAMMLPLQKIQCIGSSARGFGVRSFPLEGLRSHRTKNGSCGAAQIVSRVMLNRPSVHNHTPYRVAKALAVGKVTEVAQSKPPAISSSAEGA